MLITIYILLNMVSSLAVQSDVNKRVAISLHFQSVCEEDLGKVLSDY